MAGRPQGVPPACFFLTCSDAGTRVAGEHPENRRVRGQERLQPRPPPHSAPWGLASPPVPDPKHTGRQEGRARRRGVTSVRVTFLLRTPSLG